MFTILDPKEVIEVTLEEDKGDPKTVFYFRAPQGKDLFRHDGLMAAMQEKKEINISEVASVISEFLVAPYWSNAQRRNGQPYEPVVVDGVLDKAGLEAFPVSAIFGLLRELIELFGLSVDLEKN